MVNYKVIDNFLRDDIFQELKYTLFGNRISWSFKNYLAYPGDNLGGVSFAQYFYDQNQITQPQYFSVVEPLIQRAQINNLYRALVNLVPKQPNNIPSGIHTDHSFPHKVLLYYVNTNNGYTILDPEGENIKIQCIKNRALIFDGQTPHQGVLQSDTPVRLNINLTFEKHGKL